MVAGEEFTFEKLKVYRKALAFSAIALHIVRNVRGHQGLADQLARAALSVPLNIAEGAGRFTKKDKRQLYVVARGSVYECVPLIEMLKELAFIDDAKHLELRQRLLELARMVNGLIKSQGGKLAG